MRSRLVALAGSLLVAVVIMLAATVVGGCGGDSGSELPESAQAVLDDYRAAFPSQDQCALRGRHRRGRELAGTRP